ncbi:hypothetical protein SESBI_06484 [Sesbania bispinosa]|nr:hypothetical protein SESBI_06484 [Sesbania bispinosa]
MSFTTHLHQSRTVIRHGQPPASPLPSHADPDLQCKTTMPCASCRSWNNFKLGIRASISRRVVAKTLAPHPLRRCCDLQAPPRRTTDSPLTAAIGGRPSSSHIPTTLSFHHRWRFVGRRIRNSVLLF